MTPEEIADLRDLHVPRRDCDSDCTHPIECDQCGDLWDWPCPVVRLLDTLEERDAENARLRTALLKNERLESLVASLCDSLDSAEGLPVGTRNTNRQRQK